MFVILLMVFAVMLTNDLPVRAQAFTYRFAYVTDVSANHFVLNLIDPQHVDSAPQQIDLALSTFLLTASPDGRWILGAITTSNDVYTEIWRLFDTQTGQMRDIAAFFYDSDCLCSPDVTPSWSPDSRSVALSIRSGDQFNNIIYSTVTNQFITIPQAAGTDDPLAVNFSFVRGWSADSRQILVQQAMGLALYDLTDSTSKVLQKPKSIDICQVSLSPDGRFVLFRNQCGYINLTYYELYSWDTVTNQVKRLTDFTNPNLIGWNSSGGPQWTGIYNSLWYDSTTILTGVEADMIQFGVGPSASNLKSLTAAIQLPSGRISTLSNDHISEWALNMKTKALAYQREKLAVVTTKDDTDIKSTNQTVQIATFDGSTLQPVFTYKSGGCHLNWSPDGIVLAFTLPSNKVDYDPCLNPEQIMFVDEHTHLESPFNIPANVTVAAALGWILPVNPAIQPYFPQGTSTPIPTLVCCG
jgi:hypothetical protein